MEEEGWLARSVEACKRVRQLSAAVEAEAVAAHNTAQAAPHSTAQLASLPFFLFPRQNRAEPKMLPQAEDGFDGKFSWVGMQAELWRRRLVGRWGATCSGAAARASPRGSSVSVAETGLQVEQSDLLGPAK